MFHKKKTYHMDMKSADTALQNIFAACDKTPNSVPFDKLVLRQKAHTKEFNVLLLLIAAIITLTFLAPIPFLFFKEAVNYSPIVLTEHYVENDKLHLVLDTGNHTIKYEEAYLISSSGSVYEIVSYDRKAYTLCFPYIPQECNIYIPYEDGALMHLLITPTTSKEN